jgi:hypothetical protein
MRARAQDALASGRSSEARSLFSAAIAGYQAESGANPGRAGVNRSAIESCKRALDSLDAR